MRMLSNLKKISDIDVKFRNAFIGEARFLELSVGENKYFLTLHDEVKDLKFRAAFKLNIDNENAVFFVKNYPIIEIFSNDFKDVDLALLPDTVRVEVSKLVYGCIINILTSLLKLNFEIQDVSLDENFTFDSEKIIGLTVFNASNQAVMVGNLVLPSSLLVKIINAAENIPAVRAENGRNIEFSVFLEAGRTLLSKDEYESLEENDIIFLDDASHINSGVFELEGIGPIKASGSFENGKFVLKSVLK